jgi:hypothetical protein
VALVDWRTASNGAMRIARRMQKALPAYVSLHPNERLLHLAEHPTRLSNTLSLPAALKLANKVLMSVDP